MIDYETTKFLLSDDGAKLIADAKATSGTFLQRVTTLRKKYSPPKANAALELLDLRKRAEKKFSHASEMFFTKEALEQSSGEVISSYRAKRFPTDCRALDIGCGIGGDTISLARRCFVTAIDNDPMRIAMAQRNLEIYGLADRVDLVCADVADVPLEADAAFIDPSRRVNGRRTVDLSEISPSVEFIRRLIEAVPNCGVKLSPMMADSDLASLGGGLEFLEESGECKEADVWFGKFAPGAKQATILPQEATICDRGAAFAKVRKPGAYLYEPNACVIRAHLVDQLAAEIGAWRMDAEIAYLSADKWIETPFADGYKILVGLPFNLKELKTRLRKMGAGHIIVKKRGVPFEPREVEKYLSAPSGPETILILTKTWGASWAFICDLL